jgi:hypothetical protein
MSNSVELKNKVHVRLILKTNSIQKQAHAALIMLINVN